MTHTEDVKIAAAEAAATTCLNCNKEFDMDEDETEEGALVYVPQIAYEGLEAGTGYCSDACRKDHQFARLSEDDQKALRKALILSYALANITLSKDAKNFLMLVEAPSLELTLSEASDATDELYMDGAVKWADAEADKDYRLVTNDALWNAAHAARHAAFEKSYQADRWAESEMANGLALVIADAREEAAKYTAAEAALVASEVLL